MSHLARGLLDVRQGFALEQARPEQVLAVHERKVRQFRRYFLAHERGDLGVRFVTVHDATQPHVHRSVRVVQAVPHPRVEVRVRGVEVVVGLAVGPRVLLLHPHAADLPHPSGQVAATWTWVTPIRKGGGGVEALVRWATGKRLINQPPTQPNNPWG